MNDNICTICGMPHTQKSIETEQDAEMLFVKMNFPGVCWECFQAISSFIDYRRQEAQRKLREMQ